MIGLSFILAFSCGSFRSEHGDGTRCGERVNDYFWSGPLTPQETWVN
jgi:hypothetical protein